MDYFEEKYRDIIRAYPKVSTVGGAIFHLQIPVYRDIFLDLNYKKYPKRPKVILVKKDCNSFNLYRVVSSLRDWDKRSPLSILELIKEILLLIENITKNQILINKEFFDGLLDMCKNIHPRKLRGLLGVKKGIVSEFILPSRACVDARMDYEILTMRTCSIPLNFSYEGTFISRPSGNHLINEKLNNVFKKRRFTMLLAHPYNTLDCIRCFDSNGNVLQIKITDQK
ncbi:MAG: hypothetical protein ACXAES_13805 [Promethearchaeota archaeon]|jgi:hypothetical protein